MAESSVGSSEITDCRVVRDMSVFSKTSALVIIGSMMVIESLVLKGGSLIRDELSGVTVVGSSFHISGIVILGSVILMTSWLVRVGSSTPKELRV